MSFRKKFDLSVYFVADPSLCKGRNIADVVQAALKGGATMIQYRDKTVPDAQMRDRACALQKICHTYSAPLLVNDHVALARDIDADGVHLGQGDVSAKEAREILGPDRLVGLTAFTDNHISAVDSAIIDYIGTGPFFETQTDKGKPVLGAGKFRLLTGLSPVPVAGIGGITPETAPQVIQAGADGVAMMRAISAAPNPQDAAQRFVSAVEGARLRNAS